MKSYKHVISLGFFCSVASELNRIGLRDARGPFDWILSDFQSVLACIENDFDDLLNYNNLAQNKNKPHYYVDKKYNFYFYHDFSGEESLNDQLALVAEKYRKTIDGFYLSIQEPTLFIRYIQDHEELVYIEQYNRDILSILRRSNPENDLLLISNDDLDSNTLPLFKVARDENDGVARTFLDKNETLRNYLLSDIYGKEERLANLDYYNKIVNKPKTKTKKEPEKPAYIHDVQYE